MTQSGNILEKNTQAFLNNMFQKPVSELLLHVQISAVLCNITVRTVNGLQVQLGDGRQDGDDDVKHARGTE